VCWAADERFSLDIVLIVAPVIGELEALGMRVAILDDIHGAYEHTEGVRRLRERSEVRIFTGAFGAPAALRGFDALVANRERTRFTRSLLEQLPDLRVIAQTGNHAYHIDLAAAVERGVIVAKAAGGFSTGAAELAIGLAIALMRQIPEADRAVKRGEWRTPLTQVLHAKTLGVIGLGHVGRHVAKIAHAFDMRVLAWSPRLTDAAALAAAAERRELDQLLRESDVVSIHLTLAPESALPARCPAHRADEAKRLPINTARPDR
jgi:phosphoglycerate dehydrogenase-like enzyme